MMIKTFTAAAARLSRQTTKSMSFSFRCLSYSFISHSPESLAIQDFADRGDDGISADVHFRDVSIFEIDDGGVLTFVILFHLDIEDLCITLIEGAHKLRKCEISSRFKVSSLFFLQFFVCHFSSTLLLPAMS